MIERIKKWWFRITHIKCDYCTEPVEVYYDAYLFAQIKEYKGNCICLDCIKKLPKQKNIKNFDKLKTEEDRKFVETWSKITTVTINNDGLYMLDMIPYPGFSEAK